MESSKSSLESQEETTSQTQSPKPDRVLDFILETPPTYIPKHRLSDPPPRSPASPTTSPIAQQYHLHQHSVRHHELPIFPSHVPFKDPPKAHNVLRASEPSRSILPELPPGMMHVVLPGNIVCPVEYKEGMVLRPLIEEFCNTYELNLNRLALMDRFGDKVDMDKPFQGHVSGGELFLQNSTVQIKRKLLVKGTKKPNLSDMVYRDKEAEVEAIEKLDVLLNKRDKDKEECQYVFGLQLEEVAEEDSIPKFLQQAMNRLVEESKSQTNWNSLTVFPKNLSEVPTLEKTKSAFETGTLTIEEIPDLRTVAAFIINFFQELPKPIFTDDLYQKLANANGISDLDWRACVMHSIILHLPKLHRELLQFMILNLKHFATSTVALKHLCRCFGGSLLLPRSDGENDVSSSDEESSESAKKTASLTYREKLSSIRETPGKSPTKPPKRTSVPKAFKVPSAKSPRHSNASMANPKRSSTTHFVGRSTPRFPGSKSPQKSLSPHQNKAPQMPLLFPPSKSASQKLKNKEASPRGAQSARNAAGAPATSRSRGASPTKHSPNSSRHVSPRESSSSLLDEEETKKVTILDKKNEKVLIGLMETLLNHSEKIFEWESAQVKMMIGEGVYISAATLDYLILKLIDDNYLLLEENYTNIFLMCYDYFTTAVKLLTKLEEKFDMGTEPWNFDIRKRILLLMKVWFIREAPGELGSEFKAKLSSFLHKPALNKTEILLMDALRKNVDQEISVFGISDVNHQKKVDKESLDENAYKAAEDIVLDLDPATAKNVAEQLTLVDYDLFMELTPKEFLHKRWQVAEQSISFHKILGQFNKVSLWVQTTILKPTNTPEDRINLLSHFLEICTQCVALRNYQSAMAIYTAIESFPISRLSAVNSLSKAPKKQLKELSFLFEFTKNYYNYRKEIALAGVDSVIPVLGLLSKDLFGIEENIPTFSENNPHLINFNKFRMLFRHVNYIKKKVQRSIYPFEKQPKIYSFLSDLKTFKEIECRELSLQIEPRETQPSTPVKTKSIFPVKSPKPKSLSGSGTEDAETKAEIPSISESEPPKKKNSAGKTPSNDAKIIVKPKGKSSAKARQPQAPSSNSPSEGGSDSQTDSNAPTVLLTIDSSTMVDVAASSRSFPSVLSMSSDDLS